jgi:hypothetical protein
LLEGFPIAPLRGYATNMHPNLFKSIIRINIP